MDNSGDSSGVIGSRVESMAIVPSRAGTITLPPVTVQWWDTVNQQLRQTVLEQRTLTVKAAAGLKPDVTETDESDNSNATEPMVAPVVAQESSLLVWMLISVNLVLLIAVAVLFLLWRKSRRQPALNVTPVETVDEPRETTLFAELQRQSKGDNPRAFRHALLRWARVYWDRPLLTLQDVATTANGDELAETLDALDRSLYSGAAPENVNLPTIFEQLKQLRKNRKGLGKHQKGTPLAPLYGK